VNECIVVMNVRHRWYDSPVCLTEATRYTLISHLIWSLPRRQFFS